MVTRTKESTICVKTPGASFMATSSGMSQPFLFEGWSVVTCTIFPPLLSSFFLPFPLSSCRCFGSCCFSALHCTSRCSSPSWDSLHFRVSSLLPSLPGGKSTADFLMCLLAPLHLGGCPHPARPRLQPSALLANGCCTGWCGTPSVPPNAVSPPDHASRACFAKANRDAAKPFLPASHWKTTAVWREKYSFRNDNSSLCDPAPRPSSCICTICVGVVPTHVWHWQALGRTHHPIAQ